MAEKAPVFDVLDEMHVVPWRSGAKAKADNLLKSAFATPIKDFYLTDVISRASETMHACSQAFVADNTAKKTKKAG